jgi:hypothetical protein
MKLNFMFTAAGLFMIIVGLVQLFAPAVMVAGAGIGETPSPAYLMTVRFTGVELLGLGLIAWLVRNAEASKARDGVTLGFTLYFVLHALTSLYVQLTAVYTAFGWAVIVIQGLFAVGFFMAGKASMSTSLAQSAS